MIETVFFTEGAYEGGKFPRNFNNARTDVAWSIALNASNYSYRSNPYHHDLGIMIIPKKNPSQAFDFFKNNHELCTKWAVMQEGPNWLWQDFAIRDQVEYLDLLTKVDLIFCHNELDQRYYKGLIPNKNVAVLNSLMIDNTIPHSIEKLAQNRNGTVIGGNWVSWYSGQDSYMISQEFEEPIYSVSMGRMQNDESLIDNISYINYSNWSDWMVQLSKRKYAVHLMRTFAAGTFALNCAYLGIPCIGYLGLDTQQICHPELSVEVGDLESARKKAKHLRENSSFYDHCSQYSKKAWYDNYREDVFLKNFQENVNCIFTKQM